MLFDFQPPIVKNGETMSEKQMRDYLYKLVDKLTLVLNNIDDENMRSGKTVDTTALSDSIASLRSRVENLSADIENLNLAGIQSAITALEAAVSGKADSSELSSLSARVTAAESNVNSLQSDIAGKADASVLNNKQDKLISGTNIKTVNNQSLLGSGNITIQSGGSSYDDTALKARVTTAETDIVMLKRTVTETHFSSVVSAAAASATEYSLTFDNAYVDVPVIAPMLYNSSVTRYFGLLSLIITAFTKDSSGNYTGATFKICNNHTSALSVRVRTTIIGLKKE